MVLRKNIKISKEEAIHYLFRETDLIPGMFSSAISSVIAFVISYFLLFAVKFIQYNSIELIVFSAIFFILGIPIYFIKQEEFHLFDKTHSDIYIHGILIYPLLLLIYLGVFVYFLVPQWLDTAKSGESITSSIITALLVALIFAFFFHAVWQLVNFILLQVFAKHDWIILAERDFFMTGLGMRFEEAKRYGTSLSLVHFKVKMAQDRKGIYKKVYRRIAQSVREIDSISHFEDWNSFVVLAPITLAAAKAMVIRINKIMKDELYSLGVKSNITLEVDISSLRQEIENEYDLLKPQETIKQELAMNLIPN